MLVLTPEPLQTAAERAFFGELSRWDTGASVRAAVVASVPLVDGPLGRRQSDAVLLVPEGLAVIRVVEVQRQSGTVTATPEGAWTIAADGGPSQVLQLAGGGSTPLDGLMRAGMDTAVKLRRAGLQPGRIARLTVLVGDVTGLVPPDGDLGEGDLVATLDPRSLLLAFARASRHAGTDNPRLWTTADVRAALEALELTGRGPTVEELNGESFPYSPYVLRRPQLLAPAAMAASPIHLSASSGGEPARVSLPSGAEDPSNASAVARAVAASVASANAAAPARPAPDLPAQRDTVGVGGQPAPSGDGTGIGGLFGDVPATDGSSSMAAPTLSAPSRTSVFPVVPPPEEPAPPVERQPLSPAWNPPPPSDRSRPQRAEDDGGSGRHRLLALVAAALAVLVLCAVGLWLLLGTGADEDAGTSAPAPTTAARSAAGPAVGDVRE
ncbi:MAG TPA: hypothetical protein VD834_13625, partial [Blastococcus sp.]|nr:hypothetical protein [Blastococcus sp.]